MTTTLTIVPRAGWGARPPKNKPVVVAMSRRTGVRFHYSGASARQTVRSIQDWCMDGRGFNDIDYNYLVDDKGVIYEGRGLNVVGSHTVGWNTVDIAICAIGENGDITDAQLNSMRALYDWIIAKAGKRLTPRWHSQNANTDCPGSRIITWVKAGMPIHGAPPAPTHPVYPNRVMRRSTKVDPPVRVWQAKMALRGWKIAVDGKFGPETYDVVLRFQREKGLTVTGTINAQTWNAAWALPVT